MTDPLVLTVPQIAEMLQVSHRTVYRLLRAGLLPRVPMTGATRVPRWAVERLLGAEPEVITTLVRQH